MKEKNVSVTFNRLGVTVTTHIDRQTNRALELVKQIRKRSKAFLLKEAIEKFLSSPDCLKEPSNLPDNVDSPLATVMSTESENKSEQGV